MILLALEWPYLSSLGTIDVFYSTEKYKPQLCVGTHVISHHDAPHFQAVLTDLFPTSGEFLLLHLTIFYPLSLDFFFRLSFTVGSLSLIAR
jgi:hypothetical protein